MRPGLAAAQVDNAGRRVEEPWISVPLIDRRGETPVRFGEALNSSNRLCARQDWRKLFMAASCGCVATDLASAIEREQSAVEAPALFIEREPPTPLIDISQ